MSSASASTHLEVGEHDDVFTRQILSGHVRHETAQNRPRSLGFTDVNLFDVLRLPLRGESSVSRRFIQTNKRAAKSVERVKASTSIKSNNHPTRTNLSASSCFFALNTLPTRKSTRCSSGANSAGLPSARTTLLRARLSVDVIGVIHRCAAAPPRAMTPHRAVSDASVGRVVVIIIVDARFRPSSRASACEARRAVWVVDSFSSGMSKSHCLRIHKAYTTGDF